MVSDGKVVSNPLERSSCNNCGHGFHAKNFSEEQIKEIYGADYSIGLRDPVAEAARSAEYSRQIEAFLTHQLGNEANFAKIIEFGCGSGTLLSQLTDRLGAQIATGVEPSSRVAANARSNVGDRISIHQGFAEQFEEAAPDYNLCLSVNVIEHTRNPRGFLQACRRVIHKTGNIVVICPDGEIVGSELLFYDHISNFTPASLAMMAAGANLRIVANSPLTGGLQGFRVYLLRFGDADLDNQARGFEVLSQERVEYVNTWSKVQDTTSGALKGRKYGVFGTGEYSDLLHAYSPSVIENAEFFVRDQPVEADFYGKPVVSVKDFLSLPRLPLIAAVHERSWPLVRDRFRSEDVQIFHSLEIARQDLIP
ncbi:bifunctional 2-polyprenyl-6-hydroxyphenol methylase/3-demethylubiquinol 3-O-methyltransferase UbiG [Neorhizobium sp. T6_25]|uniref:class I SAM-dependent methyltransferase n=1 Tax=Neorhizobium sp. T6_25 TaxID=2093833 RepID=UPI000CF9C957|nr:class I SAM-dependent methyltransferase [Neorhizobium sp. T6_25]